jgi:hypothetical protein
MNSRAGSAEEERDGNEDEEDVSTQQHKEKKNPRLSGENVYQGWARRY